MKEYKNTSKIHKYLCIFIKYIPPKSHSKKSTNYSVSYYPCLQEGKGRRGDFFMLSDLYCSFSTYLPM